MNKREFDIWEELEDIAQEFSESAKRNRHAINAVFDPDLATMYYGNCELAKTKLKRTVCHLVDEKRNRDISIYARRPPSWGNDTAGLVRLQLGVESCFPFGGLPAEDYSFEAEFLASADQPPSLLYVGEAAPLPIFALGPESTQWVSIKSLLRFWGFRCEGGSSISEAIREVTRQATSETPYAVILASDPLLDGAAREFAAEIADSTLSSQTRLLYIERFDDETACRRAFSAGFEACLPRPFRVNDLLEVLVELIGADLVPTVPKNPPSVLIVEDNLMNQKIAALQLRLIGITADVVPNGQQALEALETKPYQLVLLDYEMPVLNGHETLLQIRKQPQLRNLPVIILTSNDDAETIARCRQAGMNEFVHKPISPCRMRELVSKWCHFPHCAHFRITA